MLHDARHPDVKFLTQTVDRAFDLISFGIDVSNFGIGLYPVVVNLIKVLVHFGVERPHRCTIVYDLSAQGLQVHLRIILRIELCRTSRINLFVTFPNLKTSKTQERAYNFNSLEMTKWQSTPKMLYRVSSMHLVLVSNCAWMFQDHCFKKALENGGFAFPDCVSPQAITRFADEIYIYIS